MTPGRPGRLPVEARLVVNGAALERTVVVLSQVGHASVRGIQECLAEMWGVKRSVGWIEGVLQEAGHRARGGGAENRRFAVDGGKGACYIHYVHYQSG